MASERRVVILPTSVYILREKKKKRIKKNTVTVPLLIGHLYVLFPEISVHDFGPFFN